MDVIQMESTPFAELCMTRRVRADIACPATWIASPEEIILNKVKFFELGGSEKHINDIAWIVQVRG
ncbi:MAG: hypothetical protein HYX52_09915 [Chloroflexi bacterium]|nr:hypothetical protein [Chloroflexota bacterium]